MDKGEGSYLEGARKPRSLSSRRPRSESNSFLKKHKHGHDVDDKVKGFPQSAKTSRHSEGVKRRHRLILPENSDDEDDLPPRMEKPLQELPKYIPTINIPPSASHTDGRNKIADGGIVRKRIETTSSSSPLQPVRKSSRISKKCVPDGEYVEDDEEYEAPQPKRMRKSKSERGVEELYQEEDDKATPSSDDFENSDSEFEDAKSRKPDNVTSVVDSNKEVPLTARQRAVQMSKAVDPEVGESLVEFPEGLPQTGQRKRQEKIPDFEQQLKKEDAARRRKLQAEKAAEEIQADAIKKILGQDSVKQKREEKLRKQRDEMAQEKKAAAKTIASKSVRWVIGPSGTVVSFSEDAEILGIFNSVPCRYPPAREKCAGPSCNNAYKYRDSKSNLPLCSLLCYRAIHDMTQPLSTH